MAAMPLPAMPLPAMPLPCDCSRDMSPADAAALSGAPTALQVPDQSSLCMSQCLAECQTL